MSQCFGALLLSRSHQLATLLGSSTLAQAGLGDPGPPRGAENRHMHVLHCPTGTFGTCAHTYRSPVPSRLLRYKSSGSHMSLQPPAKQEVLTGTRNIRDICCSSVTEQLAAVFNGAANCA